MSQNGTPLTIDEQQFIWYGNFKLPVRLLEDGSLEFADKDPRRSAERGTRFVAINLEAFVDLFARCVDGE